MPKAGDFVIFFWNFFFAKNVSLILLMIDFILQQGRFLSSLNTQSPALNVVSRRFLGNFGFYLNPFLFSVLDNFLTRFAHSRMMCFYGFSKIHGLVACGGEDGAVECFDMRMRASIGRINAVSPAGDADEVAFAA